MNILNWLFGIRSTQPPNEFLDPESQGRYRIVRLHPSGEGYASAALAPDIPLGQSRIGGPIIDLPEGFEHPDDLFFVAQLDLAWLAPCAARETLLPADHGFLYFFMSDSVVAQVHYFPGTAQELRRTVREHDDWFCDGITLSGWSEEDEVLAERFQPNGDWDHFAGMEKTKIGGFPSNPQWHEEDVALALADDRKQLLLQVGEDVTQEGCLCYFIDAVDLHQKRFDRCKAVWGQT